MPQFDLYGLGNALVDTEYRVSDELLEALRSRERHDDPD